MRLLLLTFYLLSYVPAFANLGFTALAWMRTRDRTFLVYGLFSLTFIAKMLVYNSEFLLQVFLGWGPVRDSAGYVAAVFVVSAAFNASLLAFLASLIRGRWHPGLGAFLLAAAAGPLVGAGLLPWWGPSTAYAVELAWDTVLVAAVTAAAWGWRSRARSALFRGMLSWMAWLNTVYLPLALGKALVTDWSRYQPQEFQLANLYSFVAELGLAVLTARHVLLDPAPRPPAGGSPELDPAQVALFGLTAREAEVTELLGRGLTLKDIADRLSVSPGTVKNHVYHIYQKTGVQTRVELLNLLRPLPA